MPDDLLGQLMIDLSSQGTGRGPGETAVLPEQRAAAINGHTRL